MGNVNQDTEIGGRGRAFPSTSWANLKRLRTGGAEEREQALRRLVDQYWKPVYCFLRQAWRKSNEDAKDLTQEFFATIVLEGTLLDHADPDRGSFRAYLKRAVANFVRDDAKAAGRQKRGGEARILSLSADVVVPDPGTLPPEQAFDAAWRNLVLQRAVEELERRLRADGKGEYFEVFRRHDLDAQSTSYRALGEQLGLGPDTVKYFLTRAREEFRDAVIDVVSDYVDNDADLQIELNDLFGT